MDINRLEKGREVASLADDDERLLSETPMLATTNIRQSHRLTSTRIAAVPGDAQLSSPVSSLSPPPLWDRLGIGHGPSLAPSATDVDTDVVVVDSDSEDDSDSVIAAILTSTENHFPADATADHLGGSDSDVVDASRPIIGGGSGSGSAVALKDGQASLSSSVSDAGHAEDDDDLPAVWDYRRASPAGPPSESLKRRKKSACVPLRRSGQETEKEETAAARAQEKQAKAVATAREKSEHKVLFHHLTKPH